MNKQLMFLLIASSMALSGFAKTKMINTIDTIEPIAICQPSTNEEEGTRALSNFRGIGEIIISEARATKDACLSLARCASFRKSGNHFDRHADRTRCKSADEYTSENVIPQGYVSFMDIVNEVIGDIERILLNLFLQCRELLGY